MTKKFLYLNRAEKQKIEEPCQTAFPNKYRIWLVNGQYPQGKMFYQGNAQGFSFFLSQEGQIFTAANYCSSDLVSFSPCTAKVKIAMPFTGLHDRHHSEIYINDVCEMVVDCETRKFLVGRETVVRKVVNHQDFVEGLSTVAITGVVFKYKHDGKIYELFPCYDGEQADNIKSMRIIGNILENPKLW